MIDMTTAISIFVFFFFKQKTAYEIGLGIPAEPLFRSRGFGPLLEDKLCLIFKLAPSVCRMTSPSLASLLVRLVVLLPCRLLRLSLARPSWWPRVAPCGLLLRVGASPWRSRCTASRLLAQARTYDRAQLKSQVRMAAPARPSRYQGTRCQCARGIRTFLKRGTDM